ncbi:MAG: anhydro-N-acetylmuramic acid kinase [Rhizobiales bacterium]|nr:anhydro-N-acetylmuramic acid kinase [Hyphomicrobiales bacterium]
MSGTSMDGIDVASVRTDGEQVLEHGEARSYPYEPVERELLGQAMAEAAGLSNRDERPGKLASAEQMITERHAEAIDRFMQDIGASGSDVDIIGFHGQTVFHQPERRLTVQIGDGAALAKRCGIPVVCDMRAADVATGGQGAPLAPVYHRAIASRLPELPAAFVNIGGVANVTSVGAADGDLLAFDTGPGNALMDDWAMRHLNKPVDLDGALARSGTLNEQVLHDCLSHDYFDLPVPKSLDRSDFTLDPVAGLSPADGAATLAHFTASSIIHAAAWFHEPPQTWVICGGGRRNRYLMELLAWYAETPVVPAEAIGCNGDAIEAEAWAYMAVRSMKQLPLTYPTTTGVPEPSTGGIRFSANGAREQL